MDAYAPIKGKCTYWREKLNVDDEWDTRVKKAERRVDCTCFVEGRGWVVTVATIPSDCPARLTCRYYIKNG
jgi:hypothetical protein